MVDRDRMASLDMSQNILMVPAADLGRLDVLHLQPQGTHLRRPTPDRDRKRVHDAALMVHHVGHRPPNLLGDAWPRQVGTFLLLCVAACSHMLWHSPEGRDNYADACGSVQPLAST